MCRDKTLEVVGGILQAADLRGDSEDALQSPCIIATGTEKLQQITGADAFYS